MDFEGWRDRTIEYLRARKTAYFLGLPYLLGVRKKDEAPGPGLDVLLADLARYCRANMDVTGTTDRETYILVGRRQVWLRIMEHLYLPPEKLYELYAQYRPPSENDQ